MSRSKVTLSPSGRGRRRLILWLSLLYALIVGACLYYAHRAEATHRNPEVSVSSTTDHPGGATYRDEPDERTTALAYAFMILTTILYALGMGLFLRARSVRIVCSNLLVLILTLLTLEASTRILGLHFPGVPRRGPADRNFWVYDRSKGWFHQPGGIGEVPVSGPDRALVRINRLGLRGGDLQMRKAEGVQRILVLGDSFVFGIGVDEEHLFTTHLESFLDASNPGNRHEVVNMGVAGYATDQELILMEELGMRLNPDVVVLVMCDNDFLGNTQDFVYRRYYKPYFELDAEGSLVRRNYPVPQLNRTERIKLFLGQESNLWNFVRSRQSSQPLVRRFLDWFQVAVPREPTSDPIEITAALVLAMAQRVGATGARFLVTNTGHRGEMTTLYHALRPRLRKPGIHLLGLEANLGEARRDFPDKLWDFPGDIHWNRDSHRLAAEVISNYISWNGLLTN